MHTKIQYETLRQQGESFRALGYTVVFDAKKRSSGSTPNIIIAKGKKVWKFNDPDWDIVIRQMAQLYKMRIHTNEDTHE